MEVFYKNGTRDTPKISFDPQSGEFEISGRSFAEDTTDFYEGIFGWLDQYTNVPLSSTKLSINSDYFNTTSYKCYLEIIKKLEAIQDNNHDVSVTWYHEKDDEETKEAGEDLQEVTMLTIQIKEISLNN